MCMFYTNFFVLRTTLAMYYDTCEHHHVIIATIMHGKIHAMYTYDTHMYKEHLSCTDTTESV